MPTFREQLKGRFAVLGLIVVVVLGVLLARLWSMQVLNGTDFVAMAEDNRVREISLEAPRGRLLDRNGTPVVTNRPTLAVCVAPTAIEDEDLLYDLSVLVNVPVDEIRERLESTREAPLTPRVITLDATPETVAYLAEHESEFPGVEVQARAVREYPFGEQASHVLGYTGEVSEDQLDEEEFEGYVLGDVVGKTGAERQFESVLQGTKGFRRFEVDATGRPRRVIEEGEPIPGSDVVLTLDSEVQAVAEQALVNALDDAHKDEYPDARAGAAVALDVRTGEVLAMASAPTYDPTLFLGGISQKDWEALTDEESEYPLTNRTMMALYPPASTFKAFTGLAGLQYGVTREWSMYYCPGKWTEMGDQWPKWCWLRTGHHDMSFHQGIVESCDTVFYEIGYEFYKQGDEKLQAFSREFGFGSPTGIDLPGELDGRVPDAEWKADFNENYPEYRKWLPGDTVNMVIGQGDLLVSPLQLAAAYGAIANGGQVLQPHVLMEVRDAQGEAVHVAETVVTIEPEVSDSNLAVMERGLEDVVSEGTAAKAFRGFAVEVAGKTGTAEVAGKDDYAWFVGYAPADDPEYVVAVVVEQGGHGGTVAAPAVREIMSALFGLPVEHVTGSDISR